MCLLLSIMMPGCIWAAVRLVSKNGGCVFILTIKSTVGCLKKMSLQPTYLHRSRSSLLTVQKFINLVNSSYRILRVNLVVVMPPPHGPLAIMSSEWVAKFWAVVFSPQ